MSPGTWMLTERSSSGATISDTGSLITNDPVGILTDPAPLNVTIRSVLGWIAAPAARFATWVAPMTKSPVPAAFDSRMRIVSPPMLTRGNMRIVGPLSATPSAGAGVALQVPTQWDAMSFPPRCRITEANHAPPSSRTPQLDEPVGLPTILAGRTAKPSRMPRHAPHVVPPDALYRTAG